MKWPKLRELGEALRSFFSSPYTTKFPHKASIPAPRFRGIIQFDERGCIGCGACVEVCPAKARALEDDLKAGVRHVVYFKDNCIYCGQCVAYCTTKEGIHHTVDYDLSFVDRTPFRDEIEKELLFCERCGDAITTREHLAWIAKRVGELSYANPTLVLARQGTLGNVEMKQENADSGEPYRSGHQRLLCPRCRRHTVLHELWGY